MIHSQTLEGWWHRRGWLYGYKRIELSWEYSLWSSFCHVKYERHENEYSIGIAFPPIAVWFHLEGPWWNDNRRELSIGIHHWSLWWNIWTDPNSWSNKTPRWRDRNFDFLDFLFGRGQYSEKWIIGPGAVKIAMPEKTYEGTIRLFKSEWKRPRGFWTRKMNRVEITVPEGIPTGEHKWGEDERIYASTFPADDLRDGMNKFVESVDKDRRHYHYYGASEIVDE